MDVLGYLYNKLMEDPDIKQLVSDQFKYYESPPAAKLEGAHIVLDPLDVPLPDDFADDKWLTEDFLFQIEVWVKKDRLVAKKLAELVRNVMWNLGFAQGSGVDEYDKATGVYRDARRYRGKMYRDDITI